MKKSKILVVALIGLLVLIGLMFMGCSSSPATAGCPSSWGSCDAILACGQSSCGGYWGGTCNCRWKK